MTRVPPSTVSNRYVHLVDSRPPSSVAKANSSPGSADTTRPWRDHLMRLPGPVRLWPRNLAPTAGPVAPSCHSTFTHSGLHSPMRGKSATSSYTAWGVVSMTMVSLPFVSHHRLSCFSGAMRVSLLSVDDKLRLMVIT